MAIILISTQFLIAEEAPNPEDIMKEISNNVSEEYVICAAYYLIGSEAIRRSGDLKTAAKSEQAHDTALQYAVIAAKEGRTEEMAQKVTHARLELTLKSMTNEIDNDVGNFSILMNKYLYRCKEIMEDPDKLMNEWADKILKKHKLR